MSATSYEIGKDERKYTVLKKLIKYKGVLELRSSSSRERNIVKCLLVITKESH